MILLDASVGEYNPNRDLIVIAIYASRYLSFLLVRRVPGDAVDVIVAQLSRGGTTAIDEDAVREAPGLNTDFHGIGG